jgi:uncharacterized protein YeeX (DUF496 family)
VARAVVTGMTEEEAAKASRAERPLLVYIYDDSKDDDDQRAAIETDRAFTQNEKVAIGARFFDCLRIEKESAKEDRVLAKYAKRAPALVFVRPNFDVVTSHSGRFNASKIFSAMCATMKKDYENRIATVLKEQKAISKERADLQRDKDELARLDEKIAEEENARRRADMNKERDELNEKITAIEEKLRERENKLYVLEPKATS